MKKLLLISVMFSLSINLFGQLPSFKDIPKDVLEQLDKMGENDSALLNCYESEYFNIIFEYSRKNFDFTDKKIGFITGSSGKTKSNKINYFKLEKDRYNHNYSPNGGVLYVFDESEKEKSGGYDAVVVYWSKVLLPINMVINRINDK